MNKHVSPWMHGGRDFETDQRYKKVKNPYLRLYMGVVSLRVETWERREKMYYGDMMGAVWETKKNSNR